MGLTFKPKAAAAETPAPKSGADLDAMLGGKPVKIQIQTQSNGRAKRTDARKKNLKPEDLDAILEDTGAPMTEELREEREAILEHKKLGGGRIRATKEAVDYRRRQVLRLTLRGVPKQTIAEHLGITLRQVYEDMSEINREMREEIQNFDYPIYIGHSVAFYDEARNIALRLATDTNEKSNSTKMAALRVALQAEDSKHDFLSKVGLFKVASPTDPFNSINTGRQGSYSDENDIQTMLRMLTYQGPAEGEPVAQDVEDEA